MFNFTISTNTAEEAIAEMKLLAAALGGGLPPMQEQPIREPAPPANDDKPRKPRAKKNEVSDATKGEQTSGDAASSTETEAPEAAAEIPDIEVVRAKLKTLGATDGFGHDKVFETLAHYKSKDDDKQPAKSASTLRSADYNALLAEIDELLKGAGK